MPRIAISKKFRFEVFKRDSFSCHYCGRKAPDVLLEVDHIEPVSKGGTNDLLNLVTACKECNSGKRDRRLSDQSVLDTQRKQLEELQARKEQIEMMFRWQKGLQTLQEDVVTRLSENWSQHVPGYSLNENGLNQLRKLKGKYSLEEIMQAMNIACESYLDFQDGKPTKESVEAAWTKVAAICRVRQLEQNEPNLRRVFYIRGILRNRLDYLNDGLAIALLKEAAGLNADLDSLEVVAKTTRSWTAWRRTMEEFIAAQQRQPAPPPPQTSGESAA